MNNDVENGMGTQCDYKTKYPIGSQWECRDGSRAVVVGHSDEHFDVWHVFDYETWAHNLDGATSPSSCRDLIRPWVDKRVFEDAVIMCACNGGYDLFLESSKPKDIHGEPLWEVARMPFKITEGDGIDK